MMNFRKKCLRLRQWANRDDGRLYQIGNRSLGRLETMFFLLLLVGLVLWQAHEKTGF